MLGVTLGGVVWNLIYSVTFPNREAVITHFGEVLFSRCTKTLIAKLLEGPQH